VSRLTALVAALALGAEAAPAQQAVWQADLQIRSLTVTATGNRLSARVVVGSEFGEAVAVRAEVLLPVGVGLIEAGDGCTPSPNPPGVSVLRARVICSLGNLPAHSSRSFQILTTTPPPGVARGFGVVAMSDTPDPRPANNFAEKTIP
jgi:hypothetical protein